MEWPATIFTVLRAALLPLGLLVPGAAILSAARLPRTLGTCFVASSALLFTVVVAFAWLRVPTSGLSLGFALGVVSLTCVGVARVRRVGALASDEIFAASWWRELGPWAALYGAVWCVLAARLVLQPLSGPDVIFRWGWLPEQMLRLGSLDFYPPRTDVDFARYFWAESIPPGIASVYAWARVCMPSPLGASFVVALQIVALHEFVWRAASHVGGKAAARYAVLLTAATPLLNWSLVIGQETGLTALGAAGLAVAFLLWRETRADRWLALAGFAATLAASAREYGACFGIAGALALVASRASVRSLGVFALAAFGPIFAWLAYVTARTGNPVYSLDFFGTAVNPVFRAYVAHTQAQHARALATSAGWFELGRHLTRWALPTLAGVGASGFLWRSKADTRWRWLAWFALPAVPVWIASLGFTAGGLFYSLRVLAPTCALAATLGGIALAHLATPRARQLAALACALLALESLPKSLVLPESPYRTPVREWLVAGDRLNREVAAVGADLRRVLATRPAHSPIVTEGAGLQPLLAPDGIAVLPLWSPELGWLFDERLSPAEVAARWQASGLRTVVLTRGSTGADFLFKRAHWRAPWFTLRETATVGPYLVLEITATL